MYVYIKNDFSIIIGDAQHPTFQCNSYFNWHRLTRYLALYSNASGHVEAELYLHRGSREIRFQNDTVSLNMPGFLSIFSKKQGFTCHYRDSDYEIVPNPGYLFSIFENGVQVGCYETTRYGRSIDICLNNNADILFLIALIVAKEYGMNYDESAVLYNFGNSKKTQPFNENWKPDSLTPPNKTIGYENKP